MSQDFCNLLGKNSHVSPAVDNGIDSLQICHVTYGQQRAILQAQHRAVGETCHLCAYTLKSALTGIVSTSMALDNTNAIDGDEADRGLVTSCRAKRCSTNRATTLNGATAGDPAVPGAGDTC